MSTTSAPALGAEGWFTTEGEPALIGTRCAECSTTVFPPTATFCPNPACRGRDLEQVELARRGRVWSYTDAQYAPPAPYVQPAEDHEPFAIAAVELIDEGLVVLGQMVPGVGVDDLSVGTEVEVVVEPLYSDEDGDHLVWKWKPVAATEGGQG